MNRKYLNDMTRKELLALPRRPWDRVATYDTIVVIPGNHKHDSGYRQMTIIGVNDGVPVEIAASCPDVINIRPPASPDSYAWVNMDCIWKSHVFQYWVCDYRVRVSLDLSTVTIDIVKDVAK